jgi:opacity protein-like surface antigen
MAAGADADVSGSKHPLYLSAGLGFSHIDEAIHTRYSAADYQLTITNEIYPLLRLGYPLSDTYALELGARWDIYSGSIDRTSATGSEHLRSTTFQFGPVYTGDEYHCRLIGPIRPLVAASLIYSVPYEKLRYPVTKFKPALGAGVAFGFQRQNADLRIGYRYLKLKRDRILAGVDASASEDELSASGIFVELSYRFGFE